jgi:hypothetical protein
MDTNTVIAKQALSALTQAESKIRQLITQAADSQDYQAVTELAELAQTLSAIAEANRFLRDVSLVPRVTPRRNMSASAEAKTTEENEKRVGKRKVPTSRHKNREYPKFCIDRERLTKTGWSKKNKSEYEHRASREAVAATVSRILNKAETGRIFNVDELVPVEVEAGQEVPMYQVYMTVAWLVGLGRLTKEGRDGYRLEETDQGINLDTVWNSTPKSAS